MTDIKALRAEHEAVFGDSACPAWAREALDRYAAHGVLPGDFLCAILANDLTEAAGRADLDTGRALAALAGHVYRHLPARSRGSAAAIEAWILMHETERVRLRAAARDTQGDV